jgi:cytochrome P450
MPLTFNPDTLAYRENPYPVLARLRDEDPVHFSPALKGWVLTRHADVQFVMRADTMSVDKITPFYKALPSDTKAKVELLVRYLGNWLPFKDPPDHMRLRTLINWAFTPKALNEMRPHVTSIVDHLLDAMHGKDRIDLVADFTNPLPAYVIMDMLGVPRSRLAEMKEWSDDIRLFIGTARGIPDKYDRVKRGTQAMGDMFRNLIAARRASPEDDMLSHLVGVHDQENGRLSDDELIATCILFLFAGHETTTSLLTTASKTMLEQPELKSVFLDLDERETPIAVEEFLRHDGPTPAMMRIALQDHTIGDRQIKTGDRVWTMLAAANRDPVAFKNPDTVDLHRRPNPHVTFGYGPHLCLGAPLARLEARIALPRLHARYPAMRLAGEPLVWVDGLGLRGLEALPVHLGSRH